VIEFVGAAELAAKLHAMASAVYEVEAQQIFLAAAKPIAAQARRNAPVVSGRLGASIVARAFRTTAYATRRYGPGAFAQVNLTRKYSTSAPYGHVVESGRKAYAKPVSWVTLGGRRLFTRRVAGFSGRYYFREAVDATGTMAVERAAAKMKLLIESRARQ
jgi:hypothetical protein